MHQFGIHHFVQSVQQRPKIWIDLGDDVSGQETELFAGFHGRTHQHDLAHQALAEHVDGHADREIRLAGTGRADAEDQIVVAQGANVTCLAIRSRPNMAIALDNGHILRPFPAIALLNDS